MATQFNFVLGYRISNPVVTEPTVLDLQGNNGIFILGRPGKGKSHLIAHILTQLAIKGSKLLVSEYNAHNGADGQTLIERIDHLKGAFLQEPKTHGKDIVAMITWLKEELVRRQNGSERYALVVVFDEFFQFASSYKPEKTVRRKVKGDARSDDGEETTKQEAPTYWNDIAAILSDARKNNIRIIMAVQESAGTGTSNMMRTVRDIFGIKLLLQSSETNAELLGATTKKVQQVIDKMAKGLLYYNGAFYKVPYPINPQWITAVEKKIGTVTNYAPLPVKQEKVIYDWTAEDEKAYMDALYKYGPKINRSALDTREDLIRHIIILGQNNEFIKSHVKGSPNENISTANRIREQLS